MGVDAVVMLLLGLAVIIVVARLFGAWARRLGQPAVIGEILGGILLGPTLFGGVLSATVLPAEVRPALSTLAGIGVCAFMFLVGMHLDWGLLRGQVRRAATISPSAIMVTFGLGALLALYLYDRHPTEDKLVFVLFLGTAMSVTAFPVLARILADRGLLGTPVGGLALACAAVDDVLAWSLLAVVTALGGAGSAPWRVLFVIPYALLMLLVVRPLLARLATRLAAQRSVSGRLAGVGVLVAVAAGVFLSARATEWMGLHAIFGAFLFGAVMPRANATALQAHAVPWIGRACSILLLPVFFVVAGLDVDLSSIEVVAIAELALILLVAIGGKFGGALLAARVNGLPWRDASALAALVNARGLTELIVLTVGLELGVLDHELYSLMVVMALVTTAMTGVLLRVIYPAGHRTDVPDTTDPPVRHHTLTKESSS